MKRSTIITLACSALVAAGCSHRTHQARYESTTTSAPLYSGTSSTYNEQIYNQKSVDNNYRSSTDLSNPQSRTTYNQTSIETTPADNTLIQQVRSAIDNDTTLVSIAPSIQVNAQGGTVTLSGNVQNEDQKRAVERAAKGTTGVVTVNNQLQVSSSAGQSSQIQPGESQTGGSQPSLYQNSSPQSQSSNSGGTSASSTGSLGASTDLKGGETNDAAQGGSLGTEGSSGAASDKYSSGSGRRLYSTKDDFGTNGLNSAQGGAGDSSLGSTNSTESPSLNSTNNSSSSPQGGSSSSFGSGTSSSLGSSADKSSSESTNSSAAASGSQGETKDLSPTSSAESSRIYSTNQADQASGGNFSSGNATSSSSDSLSLSVQAATESDQKLADQLRQELRSDSSISGAMSHLRISLNNGKATLRGTVKSDQEKQDVEKAVQKVTGVTSVQNELRVSSSGQSGADENK